MRINARKFRILIKVLIAIVVLVAVATIAFLVMQISGKNRLYNRAESARPNISQIEIIEELVPETLPVDEDEEDAYVWQEGDVRYNGTIYRYNEEILTFLFLGIDRMSEVKEAKDAQDGGQSDALFLLVLDPKSQKVSVIGIPRDTMTEVETYDKDGNYLGTGMKQICLQHGYGDGAEFSCELSVDAVSHLFYDLPIHGYCSINMGAIPLINDTVGGVELVALEDVINTKIKEGDTVHLMGKNAYYYLHNRDTKSAESAARRLDRQKQYLTAYAAKAIETMKSDITLPVTLYNTLSNYMVTDITVDEVSYLATQVANYSFSGEQMYSLQGDTTFDGEYEQLCVDEEALYKLVLDVFYEEVH